MSEQIEILLVEDHDLHARRISFCLEKLGYEHIHLAGNAEKGLELVESINPDLILMDINLPGKMDGIEMVHKLRESNPVPVIYITSRADKETFDRAKKTAPEAYLTKQINPAYLQNLQAAVEISLMRFANKKTAEAEETNATDWTDDLLIGNHFFVKVGNHSRKVHTDSVLYIHRSADQYCDIYTKDRKITIRSSLNELLKRLPETQFVRIHRAYAINLACLDSISDSNKNVIVSGTELPLGDSYKSELHRRVKLFS